METELLHRKKMGVLYGISLVLLLLQGLCLSAGGPKTYNEDELYESKLWRKQTSVIVMTRSRDSTIPEQYLSSMELHLKHSSVPFTHVKVECEDDGASAGLVCDVLSSYQLALRRGDDKVEGMVVRETYSCDAEFVSGVLQFFLGEGISILTSYTDLKEYTKQHQHHLLVLTENTTSTEFIGLLVSLLPYHTPLAVVTNIGYLPLNQRPRYYSHIANAPTFHLWSISEGEWIKLPQDDTFRVKDFMKRLQYPIIITDYKGAQNGKLPLFSVQLHPVFVFPALSGASDIDLDLLLSKVAHKNFMNYIFVKADRSIHSELTRRFFIADQTKFPYIIIIPYGVESQRITIQLEKQNTEVWIERVTWVLDSIAKDQKPPSGHKRRRPPRRPTITTKHLLLQEDDSLGLVVHMLPRLALTLPDDLKLTNINFDKTVLKYDKTAVVFYIRWDVRSKVFLHHVMAAWKKLPALNVYLGTVNCEDYTDVCSRYGVTSYPTVLLFSPSTLHTPSPLTTTPSTLTSQQLINALLGNTADHDKQTLVELTPSTLPGVLRGTVTTPLIVWCDSHVTSDMREVLFDLSMKKDYEEFAFTWMNSSSYGDLLKRITAVDDITYPTVIVLKLNMHTVHHLTVSDNFKEELTMFLSGIKDGSIQPTNELPSRSWPPYKPPLPFPSANNSTQSNKTLGNSFHRRHQKSSSQEEENSPPHSHRHVEL